MHLLSFLNVMMAQVVEIAHHKSGLNMAVGDFVMQGMRVSAAMVLT